MIESLKRRQACTGLATISTAFALRGNRRTQVTAFNQTKYDQTDQGGTSS
jgi:hypothetical protein